MGTDRWRNLCDSDIAAISRSRRCAGMARKMLRIASYNINGINTRLPILLGWLHEFAPDVACLQELKCTDEQFPAAAIADAGYEAQ